MQPHKLFTATRALVALVAFVCLVGAVRCSDDKPILDPDVTRSIPEMIRGYGYPCEEHKATTRDGYLLTMYRIPHGKNAAIASKGPIYLQHGLIDCAFTWVLNLPGQALPYILADEGYDVWMGNNRGTYLSSHSTLSNKTKEYWDFTFDEFALYDVKDMTTYVLNATNTQKLTYVGHSQGTTQMFAAISSDPSFANKLNLFVGLGPVVSIQYFTNFFFKFLATMRVDEIIKIFGFRDFFPTPAFLKKLFPEVCLIEPALCDSVIEFMCGKHKGAFNNTRLPVMASHEPGGTSVKNMVHWGQLFRTKKLQMYDYGKAENIKHYGTPVPPIYDVKATFANLTLPVGIVYGGQDTLADPRDVKDLLTYIPNLRLTTYIAEYAHLDFCWALDANVKVYKGVINLINQVNAEEAAKRNSELLNVSTPN